QHISLPAAVVGKNPVGMYGSHHRKPIFDAGILDGMTSCQRSSCFLYFLISSLKDFSQNIQIHLFRKTDNVQCRLHISAHRIHIAERIRCRNLPEQIRVFHHRRKKVQGLHDCRIVRNPINGGVIRAVVSNDKIFIPYFGLFQFFQHAGKRCRSKLRGTSAAGTKYNLFCHPFVPLHTFLSPKYFSNKIPTCSRASISNARYCSIIFRPSSVTREPPPERPPMTRSVSANPRPSSAVFIIFHALL